MLPTCAQECLDDGFSSGMELSAAEGPALRVLSPHVSPAQFQRGGTWGLCSVFLKLLSVLFYICPGLDNRGVLRFFLFYAIGLQYFSLTFLTLLMNLYLVKVACCWKIPVGFNEDSREVDHHTCPHLPSPC